jgi:hypothetical protein
MVSRGRVVEASEAAVDDWCREHLRAGIDEELFRSGNLSTVIGVRLDSGGDVVLKIRRRADRLGACMMVHRRLFDLGFPCPEPLTGLEPFGEWVAHAEALVEGGELFPDSARDPAPAAHALATLVDLAPPSEDVPSLEPPLPWTAWDHREPGLWPWPDDRDVDLNEADAPGWIPRTARAVRERLSSTTRPKVVAHGDWYTANLRWSHSQLHVAYDWDSVIAAPETTVAGLAAAVYPATRAGTEATIAETEAFLDAYGTARGRPFSADEAEEAWAAGLWNRGFDAMKQCATEGRPRSLTEPEASERLRRTGAS